MISRFKAITRKPILAFTVAATSLSVSLSAKTLELESDSIKLELKSKNHAYTVKDKRTGRTWEAKPLESRFKMLEAEQASDDTISVEFLDRHSKITYTSKVTLAEDKLSFDIAADDPKAPFTELFYPVVPESALDDGHLIFCNRASGIRLPIDTLDYPHKRLVSYANTGALDIPLFGILDSANADGLMLVFETPTEVTVDITPNDKGIIEPDIIWFDSFGGFTYDRRVSMHFVNDGGYVEMANRYRAWEQDQGMVRTLHEKAEKIDRINWMKGAAVVWGNIGEGIVDEAPVHGIHRMMLNGRFTVEAMEKTRDLGYLLGEYDNYSDITEGKLGNSKDNIEEAGLYGPDGKVILGWKTKEGLQYYNRSPRFARRAAEAVIPALLEKYPYTARFFDVHSTIQFFESYHPDYPMDRRQDMKYRQDLYGYLGELGLVAGGEAAKGWSVPFVDYTEGNMSGSYYWFSDTGHLIRLNSREEIPPEYMKFGMDPALRIPLWSLIYHDQIASTWYWGDSNGYFYDIAPELSDMKDTFNVLHATMPLVWLDHLGYGWHRDRDRMMETIYTTTRLHERLAFDDMVSHSFLNENQMVQQSEFSSGAIIQANLDTQPQQVDLPNGKQATLAPYGYFTEFDGFKQSKLWIDGATETLIESDDFFYASTNADASRQIGAAKLQGQLATYEMPNETWNIRYKSATDVTLNLKKSGILERGNKFRAVYINDKGQFLKELPASKGQELTLPATSESVLLTVIPEMRPNVPLIFPNSGRIAHDAPVSLSVADKKATIRYTLDGSEPTMDSTSYTEPFMLTKGSTIKAAAFKSGKRVSDISEAAISVELPLYASPITRGRDKPDSVDINLAGLSELIIEITDAQDGPHYDQSVIGNAGFIRESGELVSLTQYAPASAIRFDIERNSSNYEGDALSVGGIAFEDGISSHSIDKIVYKLEGDFESFKAQVGIHDRTSIDAAPDQKNGSVQFIFTGISNPDTE
ncbi:glycoside hydrolase [Pelagicoccus mobilis]|uniref:NPCBM/NEW2 domain-containing protein n=1 Tax=Pelagicoccus mobilis TaxID=415221 RepID=A0A934RUQ2_9BACT|nr:glycoside hydrolase [Pelagicoccus mobilis]MBK1877187.1 NPCBM/NEW2 domain-containing protein [Pelagicoccus mobilis]